MKVHEAEQLVGEIESLTARELGWFRAHDKKNSFQEEYFTAKCLTDFWVYLWHFLYFRAREYYYPPYAGVDRAVEGYQSSGLAGFLQDWTMERDGVVIPVEVKFVIAARGQIKTQTAIAWDTWQFVRDTSQCELVRAYTDPKATEIGTGIFEIFESPRFRARFPWVRPAVKRNSRTPLAWSPRKMWLEREDAGLRTPNIEICGMGTDPTGSHFGLGHYDDWEVTENANSEVLRAQLFDSWREDSNLFLGGAKRVCCGTPWHRDGLINTIAKRAGDYKDHVYDIFYQPATIKLFEREFTGTEPILLEDRVTVRASLAGFPTQEASLEGCQARVTFFSQALKDTTVEIREVEWNNGDHFRVNRPFPQMLGQPLTFTVGIEKPAMPNMFTLDSVDGKSKGRKLVRRSLVRATKDMGTYVFSCQMLLDPDDPSLRMLRSEDYRLIKPEDIPVGERFWFRALDAASSKKTKAGTAITTGFWMTSGFYIWHIYLKNDATPNEILLELFLGHLRVEEIEEHLRWTSFEKAHIETVLRDILPQAEDDPYDYFTRCKGKFADRAEESFREKGSIRLIKKILNRSNSSKNLRMSSIQGDLQRHRVFVVDHPRMKHFRELCDHTDSFRMDSPDSHDLLDNLTDLLREGHPPREPKPKEAPQATFPELQKLIRQSMRGSRQRDREWNPMR